MDDREMLALAAKAAGIEIDNSPFNGGGKGNDGFDLMGNAVLDWHEGTKWNPLTDDGDAMRLTVRLGMDLSTWSTHASAKKGSIAFTEEACNGDPYAATRRAIVRAAAEIGKTVP